MNKESAIKAIEGIEEVLKNYEFGRANEHALREIKKYLSIMERTANLNTYIGEKIIHISYLSDMLCSERKHWRHPGGIEEIKSLIRGDCGTIKTYIETYKK